MALYTPAGLKAVELTSPFYQNLADLIRTTTLPTVIKSLKETGRFYALSWERESAPKTAHCFWDSDAYKVMEALCYWLMKKEDEQLRRDLEEYVGFVRAAQWEDGYINSYYTLQEPHDRLTNLRDMHELYCLGHLAEFAVAYHALTGSSDLIEVCRRYVLLLHETVIPKRGYCGHQELELALIRLYEVTSDTLFLDTAGYFINERGQRDADDQTFYDHECRARGIDPTGDFRARGNFRFPRDYAYMQAHRPLIEQLEIDGHCVRAVYFLTGALHYGLIRREQSTDTVRAVERLFDDMVGRKMYVTGGIGAVARNEGFGPAYHLPDLQEAGGCYSETCASFGLMMLCERFLRDRLDSRYGDVMETALMNCVLGALATDGQSFYYENPLATEAGKPWHRSKWFDTACCPPNIVKTWGLLPTLQFTTKDNVIAVHLHFSAKFTTIIDDEEATIVIDSGYPFNGKTAISVSCAKSVTIAVRIPGWAQDKYISSASGELRNGYLYLEHSASETPQVIELDLPMRPTAIFPHPRARKDQVAFIRGPFVYCAESVDNAGVPLDAAFISSDAEIRETILRAKEDVAGIRNVPLLQVNCDVRKGWNEEANGVNGHTNGEVNGHTNGCSAAARVPSLYQTTPPQWDRGTKVLNLLPYSLRENRGGDGGMRVWFGRA